MSGPSSDFPEEKDIEVQDAARERMLRELFKLVPAGEGRSGPDALDESGHRFELKTTTKNGVSTARDVGPHTLQKWQERYWLCAKGRNLASGFVINEVYFLHPSFLNEWLRPMQDRFEADLQLLQRVSELLSTHHYPSPDIDRLAYLVRRGFTINNPHIPWQYIQNHGIPIDRNHAEQLRELIKLHPLLPPARTITQTILEQQGLFPDLE